MGQVIAETPIGGRVTVAFFPTVGINRPGTDRWPVLMTELDEIAHWVRTQAVPRLITGGEPPEPALPIHYEISIGHQDERSAMVPSSTISAATRHQQRLGAAFVRTDFVDTIGQMAEAPAAGQIAAWLAALSDEQVLERMSRLKPTETYDRYIVLQNYAILEGFRDEVARFVTSGLAPE